MNHAVIAPLSNPSQVPVKGGIPYGSTYPLGMIHDIATQIANIASPSANIAAPSTGIGNTY